MSASQIRRIEVSTPTGARAIRRMEVKLPGTAALHCTVRVPGTRARAFAIAPLRGAPGAPGEPGEPGVAGWSFQFEDGYLIITDTTNNITKRIRALDLA